MAISIFSNRTLRWTTALALAGCGGGHASSTPEPTPDAPPADAAGTVDADPFGDAPRVSFDMRALHGPAVADAHHHHDPDGLLLKINGGFVPPIAPYVDPDTGIPDKSGRAWIIPVSGAASVSVRRGDAPNVEVASDQLTMAPVTLNDPLISPTAYPEYALEPYLSFVTGTTGNYHVGHIAMNYDPPAAQRWRLTVVNGRLDTAISAHVVEVDDTLAVVPNGYTAVVFDHLAAGATLANAEVVSPRVRVALVVSADVSPSNVVAPGSFTYPNGWRDHPELGANLPIPDGTIFTLLVEPNLASQPAKDVNWGLSALGFQCRDPRYKAIVLAEAPNDPKACWGVAWGPGQTTPPGQNVAGTATWYATSGAR